ncbi:MAG TPA: OB-fold domain-containing protein [Thermoplasmata archaeon]|nr:OB-fold domain-containing protein [Thermoplasmata archaeon]
MSGRPRARRTEPELVSRPSDEPRTPPAEPTPPRPVVKRPFLLDLIPLESEKDTRLSRFYARLREGRLSTTRCPKDSLLLWPPRTACPRCHTEELEWTDLPETGRIYAFSAVLAAAPLGLEDDVPFAVGLVDLEGVPLRIFGRIDGKPWTSLRIGERVRAVTYDVGDGRVFYRFRAESEPERGP